MAQIGILYVASQLLGATLGFRLLLLIAPTHILNIISGGVENSTGGYCTTIPHTDVTDIQAILIEFFATMVLVLISISAWDPANAKKQDSISLKLGLTVSALSMAFVKEIYFLTKYIYVHVRISILGFIYWMRYESGSIVWTNFLAW